jgi:hypothetical protein
MASPTNGDVPATLPLENTIRAALDRVTLPQSSQGLIAAGRIEGLVVREGNVVFGIAIDPKEATLMEPVADCTSFITPCSLLTKVLKDREMCATSS